MLTAHGILCCLVMTLIHVGKTLKLGLMHLAKNISLLSLPVTVLNHLGLTPRYLPFVEKKKELDSGSKLLSLKKQMILLAALLKT